MRIALEFRVTSSPESEARLDVIIAGSSSDRTEAAETFRRVRDDVRAAWDAKRARYDRLLATSTIEIPDRSIERAWNWMKCNVDWLIRSVPGIGRGIGGGLDEYPWWFGCDSAYSVLGALALGQHDAAVNTIDLLRSLSLRANGPTGRVIHEANTEGRVIGEGSTAETPHLLNTVWQTFLWTGDTAFLERCYSFCRDGLLEWTLGERCRDEILYRTDLASPNARVWICNVSTWRLIRCRR